MNKSHLFTLILVFCMLSVSAQLAPVKQWDKAFPGFGVQQAGNAYKISGIQQTPDGGYIIANNGGVSTYFQILKLNMHGNSMWAKSFNSGTSNTYIVHSVFTSLIQTNDGGFIVGNYTNGSGGDKTEASKGGIDYWILKLDQNGNKVWDKTIGGAGDDKLFAIKQTTDGGYILGGTSGSGIGGDKTGVSFGLDDYWLVKLDAQGNKLWDKSFGGSSSDNLTSLLQAANGGFILNGYSISPVSGSKSEASLGSHDYWILKLDSNGNKIWDKTYGGSAIDDPLAVIETSDGGYLVGGESTSGVSGNKSAASNGSSDFWILKLNASGNKIWEKSIGGGNYDFFRSFQETKEGNYILGGFSASGISADKTQASRGSYDYWIVLIDNQGNKLWDKTYGGDNVDYLNSIRQTSDGGFIIGGESRSLISGDKTQAAHTLTSIDFWILKLNSPCSLLSANFIASCGNTNVSVKVVNTKLPPDTAVIQPWTLTYSVNGVNHAITSTDSVVILSSNAALGTIYSLISITSGPCTISLNKTYKAEAVPLAPGIIPGFSCRSGPVLLKATGAPAGGTYNWYSSSPSQPKIFSEPSGIFNSPPISFSTTYYVAIENANGCEGPRTPVTATIINVPVFAGSDEKVCADTAPFQLTGFRPAGGSWSGLGVSSAGVFTPDKNLAGSQTLTYTVTQDSCTFSATKQITVVLSSKPCPEPFIPNIITQNNDGMNDAFIPKYLPAGKWRLEVYDRWGKIIFESQDYEHNWPDKRISAGTYYYYLSSQENEAKFKGWVVVVK